MTENVLWNIFNKSRLTTEIFLFNWVDQIIRLETLSSSLKKKKIQQFRGHKLRLILRLVLRLKTYHPCRMIWLAIDLDQEISWSQTLSQVWRWSSEKYLNKTPKHWLLIKGPKQGSACDDLAAIRSLPRYHGQKQF